MVHHCMHASSIHSCTGWILKFFHSATKVVTFYAFYLMLAAFVTIYIVFIINALQFGMDQLHDSPTEDSILFIHWYVWIYYACTLLTEILWNLLTCSSYVFSLKKVTNLWTMYLILNLCCHLVTTYDFYVCSSL